MTIVGEQGVPVHAGLAHGCGPHEKRAILGCLPPHVVRKVGGAKHHPSGVLLVGGLHPEGGEVAQIDLLAVVLALHCPVARLSVRLRRRGVMRTHHVYARVVAVVGRGVVPQPRLASDLAHGGVVPEVEEDGLLPHGALVEQRRAVVADVLYYGIDGVEVHGASLRSVSFDSRSTGIVASVWDNYCRREHERTV